MSDTNDWMTRAHCTPDDVWTTDHRPNQPLMRILSKICDSCPVIAECARYALQRPAETHAGVYAGVWIPHRRTNEWFAARDILARRTGYRSAS